MKMAVVQSVKNSCEIVMNSLRDSSLNFSLQETPFSLYIIIRKSFSRSRTSIPEQDLSNHKEEHIDLEALRARLKSEENLNIEMKNNYEAAIEESAQSYHRIDDLEKQVDRLRYSLDKADVKTLEKDEVIEELFNSIKADETKEKKANKLKKVKRK